MASRNEQADEHRIWTDEEMQDLNSDLTQRELQLSALHTIGSALAATLELHEVYRVIYREIVQGLLGASRLNVYLLDPGAEAMVWAFAIVDGEEIDVAHLSPLSLGNDPLSETARSGETRVVENEDRQWPSGTTGYALPIGNGRRPQSALYVPMIGRDRVAGVMHVQHHAADAFREADLRLISILANQAAIAVQNAQMFEAELKQRVIAQALRDTAAAFSSTLNFDEVLDRILTNVGRVVPHDAAEIMLVEGGIARVARCRGMDAALETRLLATPFDVSEVANLRRMARTGRALTIPDTHADPGWEVLPGFEFVRSYAGAPMRLRGLLVGFLNLHSATPGFFTPELADHLQAFADQVAIAIENAHLYGELDRHMVELEQRVAERTRELAEANIRLRELDRLKDQFISNVSHELRTPLANVKLYLGLLDHGRPEKRDQYLETLHRESGRLANLIEDLLELSRLDMGSARIHLEPTDLNALTAELIGDRSAMASERGLLLDCQIDPSAPMVMGDPKRIIQIMTNLVANAVNYTPRGGVITLVIATQRSEEGDWVTLTVQDTGRGISAAEMPNLFTRFFRGEASRQSQAPGTGLGLAICKDLVEKMEGRITVESELGRGTAFTVWLKPADTLPHTQA